MKIEMRNPTRTLDVDGPMSVQKLLNRLDLNAASVLVICDGTLVPIDAVLAHDSTVEIRSVISGGSDAPLDRGRTGDSERAPGVAT